MEETMTRQAAKEDLWGEVLFDLRKDHRTDRDYQWIVFNQHDGREFGTICYTDTHGWMYDMELARNLTDNELDFVIELGMWLKGADPTTVKPSPYFT